MPHVCCILSRVRVETPFEELVKSLDCAESHRFYLRGGGMNITSLKIGL